MQCATAERTLNLRSEGPGSNTNSAKKDGNFGQIIQHEFQASHCHWRPHQPPLGGGYVNEHRESALTHTEVQKSSCRYRHLSTWEMSISQITGNEDRFF